MKDAFTPLTVGKPPPSSSPPFSASELSSFVMCPGLSFACGKYLVRWSHQSKHKMANTPARDVSDVAEVSFPRTKDQGPRTTVPRPRTGHNRQCRKINSSQKQQQRQQQPWRQNKNKMRQHRAKMAVQGGGGLNHWQDTQAGLFRV